MKTEAKMLSSDKHVNSKYFFFFLSPVLIPFLLQQSVGFPSF